jgi:ubiquinone/menaquinone biosynthesis C-methylase UbiE
MARTNRKWAAWVIDLLDVQPSDKVLEIGFGPGVAIHLLTSSASAEYVAGVDPSKEMVAQATIRNKKAIFTAAGFAKARVVERDKNFCALAIKP